MQLALRDTAMLNSLGSVYVDMKSDKGDCDACKEDKSVDDYSCAACLKSAKLNRFGLPRKLNSTPGVNMMNRITDINTGPQFNAIVSDACVKNERL
ncbi:hypothetical protein F2Q69_00044893 [Brassica cretica]|uniref:Uncharacterized protein n=1 Tax=Brassica cretica TaxID=69181 RepID=A0A8S9NUI9_BRACR|nr:hypothetical protein F2Q69_00044893 [Brassica cretica]